MKQIITYSYQAFDGTMFTDEDECIKYELSEKQKNLTLVMLDNEGKKIDDISEDGYTYAFYLIINSQADIDYVKYLADLYGYYHPWSLKDTFA